ncbi:hypothetical protein AMC94_17335 [Pseudomonas amygdali pv. aesculi]|nr:hypothetical protein PSYAE_20388 [Pseudomonas amygdali pv. aesculi str. 0893_23]KPW20840.1 hypothetical protein ALO90_103130 [Pseudomonas amygdali pv. aesculi]KWT06343.1 hypothetical protein AL041_00510 [Pseudomonas amygdali pv. aesculi]KWT22103.1 hypothetical protein AL043_24595 [Pseudomonas amygdali pv. aesculi]KWT26135.1 hypothetical protein AL044_20340 [Pseudomonas amygdali pv. aesculi]
MDIRFRAAAARGLFAFFNPGFHFGQIPHDATRRQIEATREFAAALHLVDRRLGQGDDLTQFLTTNSSAIGKGATLRKLGECVVGVGPWAREGLVDVDTSHSECLR